YDWLETTVSDVSPDQAIWRPPGCANSIGSTYAHIMVNTDVDINRYLYGRTPLVEAEWRGRDGLSEPYPDGDWYDWGARVAIDWTALRAYGRAVHGWLEGLLASLSEADLERPVDMSEFGLGQWKGIDIYVLHGSRHARMHGGEIACLKGLQGAM